MAAGLDRRKRTFRALKKLDGSADGQVVEFSAPKPWKMDEWVLRRAAERGIRIERDAAGALVDLIGENLMALDGELTKLELYLGTGAPVNVTAVEESVGRRRGESAWDLPRKILTGDTGGAQMLAGRLLEQGESPVFLVSVMAQVILDAWRIRVYLDSGAAKGRIIEEVGLKHYYADVNIDAAAQVPRGSFPGMLEALKECDRALKSSVAGRETLIEGLIGRLTVLKGAVREGSEVR